MLHQAALVAMATLTSCGVHTRTHTRTGLQLVYGLKVPIWAVFHHECLCRVETYHSKNVEQHYRLGHWIAGSDQALDPKVGALKSKVQLNHEGVPGRNH